MTIIQNVIGRQVFDSRGIPTVECEIQLSSGESSFATVPSGASTGIHEACELRDNNSSLLMGKSVLQAVDHLNTIIGPELIGLDPEAQHQIDQLLLQLDATEQKTKLGANAILAASLANAKVAAKLAQVPLFEYLGGEEANTLPVPMMNIINGGQHASNNLDIQEFMIVPAGFNCFKSALYAASDVFHTLKKIIHEKGMSVAVGDEGGFAPNLKSNREALELIVTAIEKAGYRPGEEIFIALDLASSGFYHDETYKLHHENKTFTLDGWIDLMAEWISDFPIISLEDVMAEEHFFGWEQITQILGREVQLVGDDVFVTNAKKLAYGIERKLANSILIKLNQIGTLSETLLTTSLATEKNYSIIVSHRSGDTEDSFIADFAVATHASFIKTGGFCRSERVAKYNQLLRINEALGKNAKYSGLKSIKTMGQP